MNQTRKPTTAEPWPPTRLTLPDTIEAIERGRVEQRELFPEGRDNSGANQTEAYHRENEL